MDLRCPHRKFGEIRVAAQNGDASIEVSCPSRWCGRLHGVTVLHEFSTRTGELLSTRQFRTPEGGKR